MQIGIVGLGRMGANMGRRLMRNKHEVVVYDLKKESVAASGKRRCDWSHRFRGSGEEAL